MSTLTDGGRAKPDGDQMRRYGRLGGVLFLAGSLATLPSSLLLDPWPGSEILFLTALGAVTGLVCMRLPWQRFPEWSLHLLIAVGSVEVALVTGFVDPSYRALYFIVFVFAALVLPTRQDVVAQLLLILALLLNPLTHDADSQERLRLALLVTPALLITGGTVRYLKETLERREAANRAFARQTIELAIRLRRQPDPEDRRRAAEVAELERAVERLR